MFDRWLSPHCQLVFSLNLLQSIQATDHLSSDGYWRHTDLRLTICFWNGTALCFRICFCKMLICGQILYLLTPRKEFRILGDWTIYQLIIKGCCRLLYTYFWSGFSPSIWRDFCCSEISLWRPDCVWIRALCWCCVTISILMLSFHHWALFLLSGPLKSSNLPCISCLSYREEGGKSS